MLLSLELFQACWPSSHLALQKVSCCNPWHPLSLLTKPTLGFTVCELLLFLTPFQTCWPISLLTVQKVSCCSPWDLFKLTDQAHPWLCSMWVAAVPNTLSSWLTKPTLGSPGNQCELLLSLAPFQACWPSPLGSAESELLLSLAPFQACWPSPPLALQIVSCCCLAPFQACWPSPPLDLQIVSACYLLISFITADKANLSPLECGHFMALLTLTV